jgi:hypothetical protein
MKIKFELTDEVTITNTTVKLTTWITGVVNGQDRPALETQALDLAKKMFPDTKWAFSNFTYMPDGFTWRVMASTRIDATLNDQLDIRAESLSTKGQLTISIQNIDANIPLHQKRDAESDLRVALIEKARNEAEKLGGSLKRIDFNDAASFSVSNARGGGYAASYMESTAKGGGADGVSLGHSEKINITAVIVVDTDKQVL